jgi:hypothetical protein
MDLPEIELTEEIHGEAIMPRDVDGGEAAAAPQFNLKLFGDTVAEWTGEHTCGTGRDGYYGAHEPGCGWVPVGRIDLREHDAEVQASLADHLADHWPMAWPQAGEQWLRDQAARIRAEAQ